MTDRARSLFSGFTPSFFWGVIVAIVSISTYVVTVENRTSFLEKNINKHFDDQKLLITQQSGSIEALKNIVLKQDKDLAVFKSDVSGEISKINTRIDGLKDLVNQLAKASNTTSVEVSKINDHLRIPSSQRE